MQYKDGICHFHHYTRKDTEASIMMSVCLQSVSLWLSLFTLEEASDISHSPAECPSDKKLRIPQATKELRTLVNTYMSELSWNQTLQSQSSFYMTTAPANNLMAVS